MVLVLLTAMLGYLCYRVIPVYLERDGFHDSLLTIAGRATLGGWENSRTVNRVMQLGEEQNFTVEQNDIQVQRIRGRTTSKMRAISVKISVHFSST